MYFGNSGDTMITQGMIMRPGAAFGILFFAAALGMPAQSDAQAVQAPAEPAAAAAQPKVQVFSAEQLALRTALEAKLGGDHPAMLAYQARAFAPIWIGADGRANAAAQELTRVLQNAGEHALPVSKYGGVQLQARLSSDQGAPLEAALTEAFLKYANDVKSGLLEPKKVDRELNVFPERPDPGALIQQAGRATNMVAFLATLPPADPMYRRLVERYRAFRSVAAAEIWGPAVRKGKTLRPGNRNTRVAQVRARLTAMGDLDPNIYDEQAAGAQPNGTQIATADVQSDIPRLAFDPDLFDAPMEEALQRFQARHGLNLDGVIGPATLKQLNTSPRMRAEQIAVNLERLRWMNRNLGERYILVNLAGFTFDVMRNGKSEFNSRVVVGKARKHRTPEFSDEMTHMVINPSWYVPTSIKENEIMPKLANDPNYLANRNMRMTANGRIVQAPGPRNALGTVKFMFPNRFAIYLHDTPSKRLFNRDVRAYSHGCVRVQRPHEFAAYLLTGQVDDPEGYFQGILKTRRERRVDLDNPVPVHITYRSAWIDENGVEQFRGDVYGRDSRVSRALQKAGVTVLQ